MMAAKEGHVGCLLTLIDARANLEHKDSKGFTAKDYAALNDHMHCVQLLDAMSERRALLAENSAKGPSHHGSTLRI